jgi:outer membrane protein OmpA-like peptidoglycan-associated protein
MASNSCTPFWRRALLSMVLVAMVSSIGPLAGAQDPPAPKWELYGGYSFFYPHADVHGQLPDGLFPVSSRLESNPRGAGAGITYNFNRWFGLSGDLSGHWGSGERGVPGRIDDATFYNLSLGPKVTIRGHYFSPFFEVLLGGHRLASEVFGHDTRFGLMAGGGVDLNLSRRVAFRMLRADYVFSNHQYGSASAVPETDVRGVRLQSGLVLRFGGDDTRPTPVGATCSAQPTTAMVGEPVTVSATANNFDPKHPLTYGWSSTGGRVRGSESTTSIDTTGLAGGRYTATARISDPKRKKNNEAICNAEFALREVPKNPPSLSCAADPSSVQSGTFSTIRCTCTSPDSAQVAVGGWAATGGSIASNGGNTAALNTSGASPGAITVSASCSDVRGLNAKNSTQVMVEEPPVSPEFQRLEARLALHSIYFPTAQPTVKNPEGGLLASQEQTLIPLVNDFKKYLETKPDAHLTLEGHADPRASAEYNQALSERRVERVRRFLVDHGLPAAHIETKAFGDQHNLTEAQVKDAVEGNPELTAAERQRVLGNMATILLASNRRVDITLSTTGQQSIRQYPFNAADSLTLIRQTAAKKTASSAAKKKKPHAK